MNWSIPKQRKSNCKYNIWICSNPCKLLVTGIFYRCYSRIEFRKVEVIVCDNILASCPNLHWDRKREVFVRTYYVILICFLSIQVLFIFFTRLKKTNQKKRRPRLGIFRYRENRLVSSASLSLLSFGASYVYSEPREFWFRVTLRVWMCVTLMNKSCQAELVSASHQLGFSPESFRDALEVTLALCFVL